MQARHLVEKLLSLADVHLNGARPWDIQVHDERCLSRILTAGSLGLGETYMAGWWDSERIDELVDRLLSAKLQEKIKQHKKFFWQTLLYHLINFQTKARAKKVAEQHYNLGNDLFTAMLDSSMNYSCGYWKTAATLEEAQRAKMQVICEKLQLQPGQRLLDIGCGWGGMAAYAAQHYGVDVVGVTISEEQYKFARDRCAQLPVNIELKDYRDIQGCFDRIVSIGMFEHVGYKNYRDYMQIAARHLEDDGLFLLHTIGNNYSVSVAEPFTQKYIFPRGMLPSVAQIGQAIEKFFVLEDWHNFGADYDKTLMAWAKNFETAWPRLKTQYSETFYRMWRYYLLSCAGAFRARENQLWQIVLSKQGVRGGYHSVR